MHTSPAFAEDVYIGGTAPTSTAIAPPSRAGERPGVTVICRRSRARDANPPSRRSAAVRRARRTDVARRRRGAVEPRLPTDFSPEPVARWLFWHQLYCWLSKAEFTLGLALACAQAMGLGTTTHARLPARPDHRRADGAGLPDRDRTRSDFTPEGYCAPEPSHLAAGSIAMLKARRRMAEILRILPGSSLVVAPCDKDLRPGPGRGAGGVVRRRRLHRAAARGAAAAGVGPCRFGARPPRARLRAACQWRQ